MFNLHTVKAVTLGAALAGLSFLGAATATAQPHTPITSAVSVAADAPASRSDMAGGADTTHNQTNGSTQIRTTPDRQISKPAGDYGPFFKQNRGRFGAGNGRGR